MTTLRDEIAMAAMAALMSHPRSAEWSPEEIAAGAYAQADAMLSERLISMATEGCEH